MRCISRPMRASSGTRCSRSCGSDAPPPRGSAPPGTMCSANSENPGQRPSPVRRPPAAPRSSSSRRISTARTWVTCSSAAVNSASRVGKWCWAAPRETPARSATTATVLAGVTEFGKTGDGSLQQPGPGVARLRSCCGSRGWDGHRHGAAQRGGRPSRNDRMPSRASSDSNSRWGQRLHVLGAWRRTRLGVAAVVNGLVSASPCGEHCAQCVAPPRSARRPHSSVAVVTRPIPGRGVGAEVSRR